MPYYVIHAEDTSRPMAISDDHWMYLDVAPHRASNTGHARRASAPYSSKPLSSLTSQSPRAACDRARRQTQRQPGSGKQ